MEDSALFSLWFGMHRSRWHHSVEWTDQVSVRVEGQSAAEHTAAFDLAETTRALESLTARGTIPPLPATVRDALRCPIDRGTLQSPDAGLVCDDCGRVYPVIGPVPILLPEAARAAAPQPAGQGVVRDS
jgi:uncharacterized protein YbaR (Trm112 family)